MTVLDVMITTTTVMAVMDVMITTTTVMTVMAVKQSWLS